jgi:hypothetical protein
MSVDVWTHLRIVLIWNFRRSITMAYRKLTPQERERFRQAIVDAEPHELGPLLDPFGRNPTGKGCQRTQNLVRAGYPIDFDAIRAPFNLVLVPVVSMDVDTGILRDFCRRLKDATWASGFTCALDGIALIVKILDPDIATRDDSRAVRKSADGGCKVHRRIDIKAWQAADTRCKKALLAQCVTVALGSIPGKYLSVAEQAALADIIDAALYPRRKRRAPAPQLTK